MKKLNINFTLKSKAEAIDERCNSNTLTFKRVLNVPGFTGYIGAPVIFVQDDKYTIDSTGVRNLLCLHAVTPDSEYAKTYNTTMLISVGKKFLKLCHRDQLCALLYAVLMQSLTSNAPFDSTLAREIIRNEFSTNIDIEDILNSRNINGIEYAATETSVSFLLGCIFGAKNANAVIGCIRDTVMHDLRILQRYGHRVMKADKEVYIRRTYSSDIKMAKKDWKANEASLKAEAKAEKVQTKAVKKAKKAAKDLAEDIDTLAENLGDITDAEPELIIKPMTEAHKAFMDEFLSKAGGIDATEENLKMLGEIFAQEQGNLDEVDLEAITKAVDRIDAELKNAAKKSKKAAPKQKPAGGEPQPANA